MKDTAYYRTLPYTRVVELVEEPGGAVYFLASIAELPGVRGSGPGHQGALTSLQDAFDDYLEAMLSWGKPVPEPVLWPASMGFDASKVKRVVVRRASGRSAAGATQPARTSAAWGGEPKRPKWVDQADSPVTSGV